MSHTAQSPLLLFAKMLLVWCAVSASSAEGQPLCFSKQNPEKTVNVRVALSKKTTVMHAVFHPSELDCLKACCSSDPKDFICNLVVFRVARRQRIENCYMFHCKRDEDCPLMTMNGVNTYNIFKGLEIINAVSTKITTTTTAATTTTHSTTISAPITMAAPTTTTTRPPTTTASTLTTATLARKQHQSSKKPAINPHHPPATFISSAQTVHPPAGHVYSGNLTPSAGTDTNTMGGVKVSLVAVVVVGLVCLTCLVVLVGRKATESFKNRKYTRLELNNLKYDI